MNETHVQANLFFQVMKDDLLAALKTISGVVESSQVMQILSFVHIYGSSQSLTLTASNSEVQLQASTPVAGTLENDFSLTVSCRKLMDICRNISSDVLMDVRLEKNWLKINTKGSSFSLATMPTEQFPEFPPVQKELSLTVTETELKTLLERTSFSMAHQDVRFFLNGLLFRKTAQGIESIATDGHRLAMNQLNHETGQETVEAIVPRKTVFELNRLLVHRDSVIEVVLSSHAIQIKAEEFILKSNLIDGTYPDCQKLIPKSLESHARVAVEDLKKALSRVAILANEKFKGAKLHFSEHQLTIVSSNFEHEQAEETLTIHYDGSPTNISFNITYILDVLTVVETDEVVFSFSGPDQTVLMAEHEGKHQSTFVIMPLTT